MSVLTTNYLTPTGREEAWRFTPLKRLRGLHDGAAVQSDRQSLISKGALPSGVTFTRENLEPLAASDDVIIERVRGAATSVAHLAIAANTEVAEPIFFHHAVVDKDATFKSVTVTVGGDVVRILPTVEFTAPGGSVDLLGVYFATAGQFFEHRMFVDHKVPHAKSRVNYKGALAGKDAHTVWIGDVLIRAAAEGTDTYELNRNLLLSDGARADSVPNL
ncbi:MAG: hypothetical protein RL622_906, partial [Actinomycetota bacterium]